MEGLRNLTSKLDRDLLIEKLSESEYPFAAWKLPNASEWKLIISLSGYSSNDGAIASLEKGFILNRFSDSHPVSPLHIKADLVFEEEIKINPQVNASQIEAFESFLSSEVTKKAASNKHLSSDFHHSFEKSVTEAIESIEKGHFEKVVLSRTKHVDLKEGFSVSKFFEKICANYENAFCSLVSIPGEGLWIGASPELLISNDESSFRTIALAGTKKLETGQALSEIAWTQKEIEEQAFVSRYIINCFKKIRLREFHEHGPKTVKAGNLAHLKTEFQVNYSEVPFEGLADQMIELLHPTSAVCGMPLQEAKDFISKTEDHKREFYSGFLGPVNFEGSTDLFVNLRCMKIEGDQAQLFAGAGITQDSNPKKEFVETELKMETLLSLMS